MSFTSEVTEELIAQTPSKTCCRKAMLFGMFYGGVREAEEKKKFIYGEFMSEDVAVYASGILKRQFSADTAPYGVARAGRRFFRVRTASKALLGFAERADEEEGELGEIVGFRCAECSASFLRGVFISTATVNDPKKGYHLEFSLRSENRAAKLEALLTNEISAPKRVSRGNKTGFYYKGNSTIADILYFIGGAKASFDMANACIERDIRNTENRATNCVARNISRAVSASQKHIAAIALLEEKGRLASLEQSLQYTARLRVENADASLSELAHMHTPPISKSGLNARLSKILNEAEEIDK